MRPVKYLQWDKRWGGNDYSAAGEKTTIAKAGCGPTCMAMVIASLKDKSVTPAYTCAWAKARSYKAANQGTYYSYFGPQGKAFGLKVAQLNTVSGYHNPSATCHAQALQELAKGNWVIACMGPGRWTSSGHFILAYKTENGKVFINDPNSEHASKECANITDFVNEVKYYFVVDLDKEEIELTKEEVKQIVKEVLRGEDTQPSKYAKKSWEKAEADGLVDGTRPQGCATREEVAIMIQRAIKK